MPKSQLAFSYLVAGSTLGLCLFGCGDDSSSSDGSDVLAAESELTAARQSFAAAKSEASACFGTYRTCAQSGDEASCRTQLKACLPAQAPMPAGCAAGDASAPHTGDGGARTQGSNGADHGPAGKPGQGPFGGDGGFSFPQAWGDGGAGQTGWQDPGHLGAGADGRDCDGGAREEEEPRGGGKPDGGTGGQPPSTPTGNTQLGSSALRLGDMRCHAPELPHGALGSCGDRATSALGQGGTPSAAVSMHETCVAKTFDEQIAKLCAKAVELCASAAAPAAQLCASITQACSSVGDAGH